MFTGEAPACTRAVSPPTHQSPAFVNQSSEPVSAEPVPVRLGFLLVALVWRRAVGGVAATTLGLALTAALLLSSCATKSVLQLVGSDAQPLSVHYMVPQRKKIDADFLVAIEELVGRTDLAGPEPSAQPGAPATAQVSIRILSASLAFVPFVYDQDSQTREYLGRVSCRVQMWAGGELIEDWTFTRERPFSVRPREHQRTARLREFRAELAGWAAQEWLEDLHWRASSNASLAANPSTP
ncbi:MAG: hypothetical protein K8963_04725 [Proteobacteria bacterium]|nr:hypothetical protein [Pseudomonadota bacterium]